MNKIYKKVYLEKNTTRKNIRITPATDTFISKLSKELGITYTNTLNLMLEAFISDIEIEREDLNIFIGSTIEEND